MPRVNVPGVGAVNFPDSMTAEQIRAAIQNMTGGGAPKPAEKFTPTSGEDPFGYGAAKPKADPFAYNSAAGLQAKQRLAARGVNPDVPQELERPGVFDRAKSFYEDWNEAQVGSAISGVTGVAESIPSFVASAGDIAWDTATAGPLRRFVGAMQGEGGEHPGATPMPMTEGVEKLANKYVRDPIRQAAGVEIPMSATDTFYRLAGNALGDVDVAGRLLLKGAKAAKAAGAADNVAAVADDIPDNVVPMPQKVADEVPVEEPIAVGGDVPRPGELLQRFEEPGTTASLDKPHGLYTSLGDVESPHADLGGERTLWRTNPDAKVLTFDTGFIDDGVVMRDMARNAGAGVHAARHFLGEEFNALRKLRKPELIAFAQQNIDPSVDWTRYYDAQEVMEGIGGVLARKNGFDAIRLNALDDPAWTEHVLLTPNAASRANVPPPSSAPTPFVKGPSGAAKYAEIANKPTDQLTQEEAVYLALHSNKSGLPNELSLRRDIAAAGANIQTAPQTVTDLANFKQINDEYGEDFGDEVIDGIGQMWEDAAAGTAVKVYHNHGDTFTLFGGKAEDSTAVVNKFNETARTKGLQIDRPDGTTTVVPLKGASAGFGEGQKAANAALKANKQLLLDQGIRTERRAATAADGDAGLDGDIAGTQGAGAVAKGQQDPAGGSTPGEVTPPPGEPPVDGPTTGGEDLGSAADVDPIRTGLASQFLEPITRRLERSGPVGQKVNRVLTFIDRAWKQNASRPISALPKLKELSESDMQDWIAVMTGTDPMRQVSPEVSALAREFRGYFDDVAARSRNAKVGVLDEGKYREFFPRENYLPQIFERDKGGHFKVRDDFYGTFTGNIQRARKGEGKTLSPEEVVEVLRTYFARSNKTIAEARFLGDGKSVYTPQAMKDRVVEWANEADAAGEDGEYLSHYLPRVFGAEKEVTAAERRFIDFAGAFETVAKLPLAVFSNANQTAATFARAGMRPAAFALKELLTSAGRGRMMDAYVKSGAGLDYMTRELMNPSGTKISAFAQGVLKYTGFSLVEKWNRVIAVNAGAGYANDLARIVRGEKGTLTQMGKEFARQDLARILAVDLNQVEEIAKRGLTQDELADAGLWMSEKTQFSTNRESLPPKWIGTPWANVLTNLKSFALKQAHFIKDELVTPAFKGRPGPLMRYLATGVPAAAVTGYVKDLVTGKDRSDDETIDVVVDRVAMILMMDQVSRMFSDVRRGQGLKAVSPTIAGDITNAGVAAYQTGMDVKDLATGDKDGEDILDDLLQGKRQARAINAVFPATRAITNRTRDD